MKEKDKLARRESRIAVVEALFAFLERPEAHSLQHCLDHVMRDVWGYQTPDPFAKNLAEPLAENLEKLKFVLRSLAPDFPLERVAPINRAILLTGMAEMRFFETPPVVVINEYIEIAKSFGEEKSGSFINGVLDKFRRNLNLGRS